MTAIIGGEYKSQTVSNGGAEQLAQKLVEVVDPDLLKYFNIVCSPNLSPDQWLHPDKIRIYWCHNPLQFSNMHLEDYHRYVFVSHYHLSKVAKKRKIPLEKTKVMLNAIEPIRSFHPKPSVKEGIRFIHHVHPRKALHVLLPAFDKLTKKYDNVNLEVYGTVDLYGWKEDAREYEEVFKIIDNNRRIINRGTVEKDLLKVALNDSHVFVHPANEIELSCLSLMEAMSAGCVCLHSNNGAMYETAANWTQMYQYVDDTEIHIDRLYNKMIEVVDNIEELLYTTNEASEYVNRFYNWEARAVDWNTFLEDTLNEIEDTSIRRGVKKWQRS